jgi:hypothetical protein
MHRRLGTGALVAALVALGACRAGTVRIEPVPHPGDRARYRYDIEATITRSLDDGKPTTTTIGTELIADQEVVALTDDGVEADVTLRRDGAAPRTARVQLDSTGAIHGIELVEGLSSDSLGLAQLGALLPPMTAPPAGPLAPGAHWSISEGALQGHGRLARLDVADGADVAVVDTSLIEAIDDAVAAGASAVTLLGELRSESTAAYDIADGSIRRSSARSRGEVRAQIEPPPGIDAAPVLGTISYDIRVRVTRLD